jgi:type II secretory pathway component PulJ
MHKTKNHSLTTAYKQQGFTLFEMVLSTGLAALMMVAIIASLLQFNKHKLLAQTVIQMQSQSQLAVFQVLRDWRSLCGIGVTSCCRV